MFFAFGGCRAAVHAPVVRVDREASLALPLRRAARSACSSAGGASPPARRVQRALGLDYGRRVVGLAVSTLGLAPRPLEGLPGVQAHEQLRLAADVLAVAQREACDAIVVGLPVTQAGSLRQRDTDSQQGRRCRNFAGNMAALAAPHAIPVFLADERGSTVEALEVLASSGAKRSLIAKVRGAAGAPACAWFSSRRRRRSGRAAQGQRSCCGYSGDILPE